MTEFYAWSSTARTMITFLLALCVLLQTVTMVLSFYRYRRERWRTLENLLELLVLGQIIVCSLLHGQIVQAYGSSLIPPTGYAGLRVLLFILIALFAIATTVLKQKPWPLFTIVATCLTLPFWEPIAGGLFAFSFMFALAFWLIRSISIGLQHYRDIHTNLSALSIKNAIDSLHTGLMFYDQTGFVLLVNTQMQHLMKFTTGAVRHNGRNFFDLLTLGDIDPLCKISCLDGQYVTILPDGSAWQFTMTEIPIKKKTYVQLAATDISEQWKLTSDIQSQNEELFRRQDELKKVIENLQALCRDLELQKAKMRAHDVLGERLTLLLHAIRNEQTPDYSLLRNLSKGLIDELMAVRSSPTPRDELDTLKQTFEAIGVEIMFVGNLPEDPAKGRLFADIIREAITNAVRHGLATQVNIVIDDLDGDYLLRITDNGYPPVTIKEGGGISGMRKKLGAFKGVLTVTAEPQFTLCVDLPK